MTAESGVKCEFTTVTFNGKHAPKHVLAAWITDAKTNFIKTISQQAGKRQKYLFTYMSARKAESNLDGVTGATLKAHGPEVVTWNCRDAQDKPVPAGKYLLFVEFTEAHSQGPLAVFPVEIGPKTWTRSFPDEKHVKGIKLTYTPKGD